MSAKTFRADHRNIQQRPMSDPTWLRILYVGRQAQIYENLQTLIDEQNRIAIQQSQNRSMQDRQTRGNSNHIPMAATQLSGWPLVELVSATNQKVALQLVRTNPPAALFVELEQKPASRLRFCEIVRYRLPTITILAVAGYIPEETFDFDGILSVPLILAEVVEAVQKIRAKHEKHLLELGPISLNLATRTVVTPNGQYTMTPKQCALLKLLIHKHGQVVARSQIMKTVWETSYLEDTRTLDVHIRWLRERIEQNPSKPVYLKTVRGVGYRFDVEH